MNLTARQVNRLQVNTHSFVNWLLRANSSSLNQLPVHDWSMLGEQVLASQRLWPKGTVEQQVQVDSIGPLREKRMKPVSRLVKGFQSIRQDVVDAIVFSSAATGDMVRYWSDLDILVIINDKAWSDGERLKELRSRLVELEAHLYEFDPYQHHGFQYILARDMQYYPQFFLPLAALSGGKSLMGDRAHVFILRDDTDERRQQLLSIGRLMEKASKSGRLFHHCRNGICLQENYANRLDNFYQFKYFVSLMALVPSLYISLVESPVYKRDSFHMISRYFNEEDLELIRSCEAVRSLFSDIQAENNEIPLPVLDVMGKNYFARADRFMKKIIKSI